MSRWMLMKNTQTENLQQHSLEVAAIVYKLVEIRNSQFGGKLNPAMASVYGIYHDALEIFTGDFPTPVKQFAGGAIKKIADQIEAYALDRLIAFLPEKLQSFYRSAFQIPAEYKQVIKAADRISALIKCHKELAADNREFAPAAARLQQALADSGLPEVQVYLDHLPEYRVHGDLDQQFRIFVITHALALIKTGDEATAAEEAADTLTSITSPLAIGAVQIAYVLDNRSMRESLLKSNLPEVRYFAENFIPPGLHQVTLDELLNADEDWLI